MKEEKFNLIAERILWISGTIFVGIVCVHIGIFLSFILAAALQR